MHCQRCQKLQKGLGVCFVPESEMSFPVFGRRFFGAYMYILCMDVNHSLLKYIYQHKKVFIKTLQTPLVMGL